MQYSVAGVKPTGSIKNRQAVAEFQGQTMSEADLKQFWKRCGDADAAAARRRARRTAHQPALLPSG